MQIDFFFFSHFFKVGLDPLLREKIWDFLVETTRTSKLAVIITTHYIEEAKQANCVSNFFVCLTSSLKSVQIVALRNVFGVFLKKKMNKIEAVKGKSSGYGNFM